MAEYTVGLDPGQTVDPTAIAVVQRIDGGTKPLYRCGHLERLPLNTTYPDVITHTRRLLQQSPLLGRAELVLDLTGIGRPVGDMFRQEGLHPIKVTITAGHEEKIGERGEHHVAKLILVSQVQALLHDGRLQIQKDLAEAPVLRSELEDFRATVSGSGRWTFGARSGAHDDLVLALSLAIWRANKRGSGRIDPSVLVRSAQIRTRHSLDNFSSNDASAELRMLHIRAISRGR